MLAADLHDTKCKRNFFRCKKMMLDGNLSLHTEIKSTQNGKNIRNIKHIFLIFKFLPNIFDFLKAKMTVVRIIKYIEVKCMTKQYKECERGYGSIHHKVLMLYLNQSDITEGKLYNFQMPVENPGIV